MNTEQIAIRIEWPEPCRPGEGCSYDHVRVETPIGEFLLTWKGWKDVGDQSIGFDATPWGEIAYKGWYSIEEAKQWAEEECLRRIKLMLVYPQGTDSTR